MRSQNLAAAAVLLLSLAGCASTAGSNTYVDELRERNPFKADGAP
jgi:outer membrane lipoprotein SlyB